MIVPYIAKELLAEIEQRKIELNPIVYQERMDKSSGKVRKIGLTSIKQQVYDYILTPLMAPHTEPRYMRIMLRD